MKKIKHYVDTIDEELEGALEYAECAISARADGDEQTGTRYKEMATDELKHAMYIHDIAVKVIDSVKKIYTAPPEMQKAWEESHADYVQKVARIRQMLS